MSVLELIDMDKMKQNMEVEQKKRHLMGALQSLTLKDYLLIVMVVVFGLPQTLSLVTGGLLSTTQMPEVIVEKIDSYEHEVSQLNQLVGDNTNLDIEVATTVKRNVKDIEGILIRLRELENRVSRLNNK
jgi:spore germination protein GerM